MRSYASAYKMCVATFPKPSQPDGSIAVVVIPAGVAHKGEAASPDLLIVGAYPGGRGPDMRIPGKDDREQALANIAAVPPPATDPVYGRSGPLIERRRTGAQR